jgi:hypothetical protein
MQEQLNNQENSLRLMNLYSINKYIQKLLVSKSKKMVLVNGTSESVDLMVLDDLSKLVSLGNSSN